MAEPIITKRCNHCKQVKYISEFHRNRFNKDGHHYWCKICHNAKAREYQKTEQYRQVHQRSVKKYRKSEKGKITSKDYRQGEKHKNALRSYIEKYPKRDKAKTAVNNAVKLGKLPKVTLLTCHYCPKPAKHYHHWHGYEPEHWLDVVPACIKCHKKVH